MSVTKQKSFFFVFSFPCLFCYPQIAGESIINTQREEGREEMEKYFGNAYRGDPGVPHADADRFVNIWIGSAAFSALTWVNPYMWQLSNQFKY